MIFTFRWRWGGGGGGVQNPFLFCSCNSEGLEEKQALMYRPAYAVHPVLFLVLCFLCFLCVLVCSSDDCAFLLVLVTLITLTLLLPLLKASCQSSSFPDIANLRKNRHLTRNHVTFFSWYQALGGGGRERHLPLPIPTPRKLAFSWYVLFSQCRSSDITLENCFSQISSYSRTYVHIMYEKTNEK